MSAAFKPVGTNATENAACEKTVKDFNDKIGKWTYTISSYSAESMSKARKDLVKAKEEPKKEEPETILPEVEKEVVKAVKRTNKAEKPAETEKKTRRPRAKKSAAKE